MVERAVLVHRALEGQAVLVAREAQRAQAAAAARDPAGAWAVVAPPSPYPDRLSEGRQPSRTVPDPPRSSASLKDSPLQAGHQEALLADLFTATSQSSPSSAGVTNPCVDVASLQAIWERLSRSEWSWHHWPQLPVRVLASGLGWRPRIRRCISARYPRGEHTALCVMSED